MSIILEWALGHYVDGITLPPKLKFWQSREDFEILRIIPTADFLGAESLLNQALTLANLLLVTDYKFRNTVDKTEFSTQIAKRLLTLDAVQTAQRHYKYYCHARIDGPEREIWSEIVWSFPESSRAVKDWTIFIYATFTTKLRVISKASETEDLSALKTFIHEWRPFIKVTFDRIMTI
ncbi:hypothetical protein EJ05DRAFT_505564 [Pseudovirgaria hyperparasitica]|uniref:Uncharacterized protein n=1 Tax=Pseudovirgaria hyperparasitica TaxID=470096 RepID=A0A6A6VT41_9PEZI|nr:uncharacterized protein EJ05DRAFT_505564 [Pseudovirgaria hyperparasitica]KAF2752924.1 hypothetical protein EJ05DRAFT_505564 [Pseudovirgaria hyperparasitica]